jgi:hypothetical protein
MDENLPDRRLLSHPLPSGVRGEDLVVAAIHRLKVEVWWMIAARKASSDPTFPRQLRRRVPGAHCPVSGCVRHRSSHRPDDPPLSIPVQRLVHSFLHKSRTPL